jgi:transposase-like protein
MIKIDMHKIDCPDCGSSLISRHLIRKNKKGNKQVYRCRNCRRIFVEDLFMSRMRFDKESIVLALNLFNEGYSYGDIQKILKKKRNTVVSRSTIFRWIIRYSKTS